MGGKICPPVRRHRGSWEAPRSALAASPRGRVGKTGNEGRRADLETLVRLTDPSHQGRQDLQVLGLLDVKEGEGAEEEREDGLVTKTRVRRCGGRARAGRVRVRGARCSRRFQPSPGLLLTQVCAGNGRGPLGQTAPPGEFLGPELQQKPRSVRLCCASPLWS